MLVARRWLVVLLAVLFAVVIGKPRLAHADSSTAHSVSVAVLSFDSDDAEEQADALTGALRSRIRTSQGWSLVETTQSLGMLTAALRCPGKPIPAECEQRIADQIKSERYIFGYLTKGPQSGQVTAEIHLYQKSKPDTVIRESYADNLKDQNDEALRKIALRILERLGGNAVGVIAVRMGSETGEIVVDGDKRVPLQNGTARLELAPGSHSVELAVTGQPAQKRNVLVTAGKETVVDFASATVAPEPPKDKPFPTRKVIGGSLVVIGVAAGVVSVVNLFAYKSDNDKADEYQAQKTPENPLDRRLPENQNAQDACGNPEFKANAKTICGANDDAKTHSTIAAITGIAGGVALAAGVYLFLTAPSSDEGSSSSAQSKPVKPARPRVTPILGHNSGGLVLSGSF